MATKKPKDIIVVDTSVILHDSESIFKFRGYDIVIPLIVLDEVDKFRSLEDEKGRNARNFIRILNRFREKGDLNKGVPVFDKPSDGNIRVKFLKEYEGLSEFPLDMDKNDDKILAVCLRTIKDFPGYKSKPNVSLVTKDISLTVKAHVLGIGCIDYSEDRPVKNVSELYSGFTEIEVDSEIIDKVHSDGGILVEDFLAAEKISQLYENIGITLIDSSNSAHTALVIHKNGRLNKLKYADKPIFNGIGSKNREQSFALELLMDPDVKLITLTGAAGCGKTLLAIVCALKQVYDNKVYKRLIISRPIQPLGRDIGFTPGSVQEKLEPWLGPIKDSIEFIFNGDSDKYNQLMYTNAFDIEPLTYIRGRSLPNTLFILDEAQNLTRHEMKTIISRMGKNSKIILTGDVYQIDNHYLDSTNNGLTIVAEKFKEYDVAGHITLVRGQRSELATLATDLL